MFNVDLVNRENKTVNMRVEFKQCVMKINNQDHRTIICYISDTENRLPVAEGRSLCSPKDTFNKNKGRKIALGRALKMFGINVEKRKIFWNKYFETRHGKF